MKYFKLTEIDAVTGISANSQFPANGTTFPELEDINILFQDKNTTEFWYAAASDLAFENKENQCYEITLSELADALDHSIAKDKMIKLEELNDNDRESRRVLLGKYDVTALIADMYKYEQAKAIILGTNDLTEELQLEANIRGIPINTLAQSVIAKHDLYVKVDALICGLRGKLQDRIENFAVDKNDPIASLNEWNSQEDIGNGVLLQKYNGDIYGRLLPLLAG